MQGFCHSEATVFLAAQDRIAVSGEQGRDTHESLRLSFFDEEVQFRIEFSIHAEP